MTVSGLQMPWAWSHLFMRVRKKKKFVASQWSQKKQEREEDKCAHFPAKVNVVKQAVSRTILRCFERSGVRQQTQKGLRTELAIPLRRTIYSVS